MDLIPFLQSLAYLAAICGFVWYMRKDAKEDMHRMKDDMNKLDTKLEAWRNESMALMREIQQEMKDFHGRLCAIEERYRSGK